MLQPSVEGNAMLDFVFIGVTVLFFGIAVLYVRGCERLRQEKPR